MTAGNSARTWAAAAVLALAGTIVGWPLMRAHRRVEPVVSRPDPPRPEESTTAAIYLERVPVALWLVKGEQAPEPLTVRARRLAAAGGLRDTGQLEQLLRDRPPGGAVTLDTERGAERWQLHRHRLAFEGEEQTLVALTPMEHELESESMQAWQQLVQILTHEIMNSLTPIKSLSETALELLDASAAQTDLLISVRDNGPGVHEGLEQQIFLPFFTTRENGQGIGLAIVRRLVRGMGGRVRYVRSLQRGATFLLIF